MKKLRLFISALLILCIAIFSTPLFTNDITVAQAATSIRLSDKSMVLELGHYNTLKIYGTTRKASWHSSNNWVATVSSTGKVTAKAVGSATITATVSGQKLTCKLNVIRISKKALTMANGSTNSLTVTGTKSMVTWTTSDPSIASVSANGLVTANAAGIATITATVDARAITSTITVIDINAKDILMEYGGITRNFRILSINNTTGNITWSSNNTAVATVTSEGKVLAQGAGSATITANVDGVILTCNVKVLAENARTFTLKMGETKKLEIYGTTSEVTWHSNKRSVALVSNDGTVSTVAPGTATIMAYVDGIIVSAKVTVTE